MNRRELITASSAFVVCMGATATATATRARVFTADDAVLRSWLDRWLAAFNADAVAYSAFVRAYAPDLAPYLDDDLGVQEVTGGFELLRSGISGANEITAWVRDRDWDRFSKVTLSARASDRLDDIGFSGAPAPDGFSIPRLGETGALSALADRLEAAGTAGRFSGAVRVARNGRSLFERAAGLADVAQGTPATSATRYCIGSMGKMFTAVAVMQLVERGRIRLTDTLGAHLPAYPNRALADRVTIEHLLTHTGGTGDIFGPDYDAHADRLRTPADLVRFYGERGPEFEPGSRWGYSNYGFVLLGAVVEQATGAPYETWFAEHVFAPAGMSATSGTFASPHPTARPYSGSTRTGLKALQPYEGLPAGGGYSTTGDLLAFAEALRNGALVRGETLTAMTASRVAAGSGHWGLGFNIRRRNGALCYGHGGSAPGVNADLAVYPGSGFQTVVLTNRGHPAAVNIAEFIGARLPDQPG